MPEMDGIEAVRIIRQELNSEYSRSVPIIALTANALVGNTEMFLSKGFNGYISKPIDIVQLDEALNKWIKDKAPVHSDDEQQLHSPFTDTSSSFPSIPGVDVKKGIAMIGGKKSSYRAVLSTLSNDVKKRLSLFQTPPDPDTLPLFTIEVHSLKGSTASVGAAELSDKAAKLEAAGRDGDMAFIREHLGDFYEHLTALVKNIDAVLEVAP